jgi:hypothetical protein
VARRIQEEGLRAIEEIVRRRPDGVTAQQIADELEPALPRRTLQYRLKSLVDNNRLVMEGEGRCPMPAEGRPSANVWARDSSVVFHNPGSAIALQLLDAGL